MYGSYGFTPETPEPLDWELLQLLVDDFEHRPWTAAEVVNRTNEEPAATWLHSSVCAGANSSTGPTTTSWPLGPRSTTPASPGSEDCGLVPP